MITNARVKGEQTIKQLLYIGILPLLFYLSAYHALKQTYPEVPLVMKWVYTFTVLWVALFLYLVIGKKECLRKFSLKEFVNKNFYKILLFNILVAFNVNSIHVLPRWDSQIYYSNLVKQTNTFDFSLSGLLDGFCIVHPSHGYFCFLAIGTYLAKNPLVGTMAMQMVLYIIAIMCYYGLLCILFSQVPEKNIFLGTLFFAFSPLIYGIEPIISCDFGIFCYLIIFIYVSLKKYHLLELWVAVLLILSKEQGVLYYTMFYGIVFLVNMTRHYKKNRQFDYHELKRLFLRMIPGFIGIGYYLLSASSPFAWIINMNKLSTASGKNNTDVLQGIGINADYMIEKLKQIFVLNFSWIYWIVFIIGIAYAVYAKRKSNEKLTLSSVGMGLCGIGGVFFAVNLLVVTYADPRYLNIGSLLASIGAFWAINTNMISGRYRTKILCSFIVIALLSSFYSLDPISFLTWKSFKVGKVSRMYLPIYENPGMRPADIYADHTDYNRQNGYFTLLEEKMLRTIQYDGTIPLMEIDINKGQWEEDPWKYDYIYMQLEGLYGRTECYWNQEKGKFSETFSKGAEDLPMNVVYFNSDTILKGEKGYRDVPLPDVAYVLLLPRQDVQGILDVVKTRYEIQETYDVSLHGMSIYVYKVEKLK